MSKPVVATVSLAGCFGCHMSFLDMDEKIFELAEVVELHKSPLTDFKTFQKECDIGLIEGGLCNSENVHVLKEFRKHCKILVSVGECAIMGGLPALRNFMDVEDCLKEAYLDGPTVYNPDGIYPNDEELPVLTDRVYTLDEVVHVDYHLPGCPPTADMIYRTLKSLVEGSTPEIPYHSYKFD